MHLNQCSKKCAILEKQRIQLANSSHLIPSFLVNQNNQNIKDGLHSASPSTSPISFIQNLEQIHKWSTDFDTKFSLEFKLANPVSQDIK